MKPITITHLLELLRRETAGESRIARPQTLGKIPTLERGHARTASPQLAERFRFAGRWDNAILGTSWLSIRDMESSRRRLATQIELRAENWPRSAPARIDAARLSVFAIDENDQNETYLVWDRAEPRVFEYFGATEKIHRDLRAYLRAHLSTALALGPNTLPNDGTDDLGAYLSDDDTRLDRWVEGLARWGQLTLTRAAVASARLVLPLLERGQRGDRTPRNVLALVEEWVGCPCLEHEAKITVAARALRPISPELSGGKKLFEAGHCICYATYTANWLKVGKPLSHATRARLERLIGGKPADVARQLNAEQLPSPSGTPFTPATAKSALAWAKRNLDGKATWAGNTASAAAKLIGKPTIVRDAIRAELSRKS